MCTEKVLFYGDDTRIGKNPELSGDWKGREGTHRVVGRPEVGPSTMRVSVVRTLARPGRELPTGPHTVGARVVGDGRRPGVVGVPLPR